MWKISNRRKRQNESRVRPLIEARISNDTGESILSVLSNDILYVLTKFCVSKDKELPNKSYSGDTTLFELGCYLYFLVDLWHVRNGKKEYQNEVVSYLMDEFIKTFSIILDPQYANMILQNRLDVYSKFANKDSFIEDALFYLEELILRTGDNEAPAQVDINNFGALTLGAWTTRPVRIAIQQFLVHFTPLMSDRLKTFYESIEETE